MLAALLGQVLSSVNIDRTWNGGGAVEHSWGTLHIRRQPSPEFIVLKAHCCPQEGNALNSSRNTGSAHQHDAALPGSHDQGLWAGLDGHISVVCLQTPYLRH